MSIRCSQNQALDRRRLLQLAGAGFGLTALRGLLSTAAAAEPNESASRSNQPSPLAPKAPHFAPRAKRAIFLFMPGGPSQVDTFDPKPRLTRDHGQPAPHLYRGQQRKLMASPFKFQKHGQAGIEVSEIFPHLARRVDDLCLIRSMVADDLNHPGGVLQMNTGDRVFSRPSLGSWLTYGLGTENQNLPGFIALGPGPPIEGARQYGASFLPGAYQGTFISDFAGAARSVAAATDQRARQQRELAALAELNRLSPSTGRAEENLNAQIAAFELAHRMQVAAPEAFDLEAETESTRRLYGIGQAE
ncbi:MAG TPA: DUF1501 domain-containing protein, partial [Pirellulales bacterium]|nr:DUF1501 domain-containing protein [Pirellulales bacterium]